MTSAAETIRAAAVLAERGLAVFPCRADKRPATTHGFKDAVRDPTNVAELWSRHPGPLIGVATGAVSGVDVLDLDAKHDEARAWWAVNRARLPRTWGYRTRSGGLHLWFVHRPAVGCTASRVARGIDTRGDGGYVIFWPAAGMSVLDADQIASWPDWLLTALRPPAPARRAYTRAEDSSSDASAAIAGACRVAAEAAEGNRNAALFWAACRLGEHAVAGRIATAAAEQMLMAAANAAGLPDREARTTIASAWRRIA